VRGKKKAKVKRNKEIEGERDTMRGTERKGQRGDKKRETEREGG